MAGLVVVTALIVIIFVLPGGSHGTSKATKATVKASQPHRSTLTIESQAASWQLPAPVSRMVVLPYGQDMMILGGLTATGKSASGVFLLDPASGALNQAGGLPQPTHDGAGSVINGLFTVFGGGSPATVGTVQAIDANKNAKILGTLPQPRSDLASVAVGTTTYLVGGFDGATLLPTVLATTDGVHFQAVAELPEPVRYPAVAALGDKVFVFGGQSGSTPTKAIQEIDTTKHSAKIVGSLPSALSAASAVNLGGAIFVLGGQGAASASSQIWRFDPRSNAMKAAGHLPNGVSFAAAAVLSGTAYLIGGENRGTLASVIALHLGSDPGLPFTASGASPFQGQLLIADRGNNRLIVVDSSKHVLWTYPSSSAPPPTGGFYYPDDAFFTKHGTAIISNEEGNDTILGIGYPSGSIQWHYGHPGVASSLPGYLNQPDDAYLLPNGMTTVADAQNCRILFISAQGTPVSQIGQPGHCIHDPPRYVGYPNGDTPLSDGNVLVSEIHGSWVSEYTPSGQIVWTRQLPIRYPSDPQQIGPDLYIISDYSKPGGIYEFNREGQILWSYKVPSGPGMLDHNSLAEVLPGGLIATNDDYRHRVVIIDPKSGSIVWQYGVTDQPGTGTDELNIPDGFDLLVNGQTPTHPQTG